MPGEFRDTRARLRSAIVILACATMVLLGSVGRAEAQSEEASQLFRAARSAYDAGEFDAAARAFESANELVPSAAALYNAGVSWREAGEVVRAADAFERALSGGVLTPDQAADARAYLDETRERWGRVEVAAEGEVSASDGRRRRAPCILLMAPGSVDLMIRFRTGGEAQTTLSIRGGENTTWAPEPPAPTSASASSDPAEVDVDTHTPASNDETAPATRGATFVPGVALVGSAGVVALVVPFTGARAVDARDAFLASDRTDARERSRAARLQRTTNAAIGVSVALAATGVALLLRGRRGVPPRMAASASGVGMRF